MNTKTFAQTARRILMEGVAQKLLYWGFTPEGEVVEEPVKVAGGYTFRGEVVDDETVPELWRKLRSAIRKKGTDVIVEEAAYTWFNRIMALRIMAKNDYEEPQLSYVEGMEHTPYILQRARQGDYSFLNTEEQTRLRKLISDYNKDPESFALLLVGYCHSHQTLNNIFGKLDDYTELLLPDNMLQENGFLHLLNTTDAISDDDYKKVELIGWLYQFYISERKDEVFAAFKKNKKAEAKDIPAATQIFTPNWIVKYMVENTVGKLWLDRNPDSPLKKNMKYLVENESDGQNEPLIKDIEELTLIDPASGSGHILVEGFDLLYQMYMEEYYTPEEAVETILSKNLYGLDIDDRAVQLATFAILLKAAQKYRDVFTKGWMPQVYAMPEAQDFTEQEVKDFLGEDGEEYWEELSDALELMKQAKNLGSVMKLSISDDAQNFINERFKYLNTQSTTDFNVATVFQKIKPFIPILLLLTKKYSSVVANPPYMGQKNMNDNLKTYVSFHYSKSKIDLYSIFIEKGINLLIQKGKLGFINPPSWMFTSSFADLRRQIVINQTIDSLLNLGRGVFGVDFGSTAYIISNELNKNRLGVYRNLFREKVTVDTPKQKEEWFLDKQFKVYYNNQNNFLKIKNVPLAFWLPKKVFKLFEVSKKMIDYVDIKQGLATGENARFRRCWHEPSIHKIGFEGYRDSCKWFPYNSGGQYRKWYGNHDYVVNWLNHGYEIRNFKNSKGKLKSRAQNTNYYFLESGSWSKMTASGLTLRYYPEGFVFDVSGCSFFGKSDDLFYFIGLLNSPLKLPFIDSINQSFNYEVGQISNVPIEIDNQYSEVVKSVKSIVDLSKNDWDSFEISWNFKKSPLFNETNSLISAFRKWQKQAREEFFQLHTNEEELNRNFIEIYGLQDELAPEVALKDITILQDELDRNALQALEPVFREKGKDAIELPIDKAEVMSQFISYCIGIFMGRYRLDKEGLNIAHPNPTAEELANYTYNNHEVEIDEDAILPLMGNACNFHDDVVLRIHNLLDVIWGHDTRTENLNFIQNCLYPNTTSKDLNTFLVNDFYKYHCKMYKKKPIYWLFSSKNGAFQVLVYMHRMNEFTVEKIRANYLLEHLKNLRAEENMLKNDESSLNTQQARKLEQLRKDIQECQAYDLVLKDVADQQIKFDLDDGVTANYKLFEKVVAKI